MRFKRVDGSCKGELVRRLNAHVVSLLSRSGSAALFLMPVEVVGRSLGGERLSDWNGVVSTGHHSGRLSSFGFSGTIAHGEFIIT